MKLTEEQAHAVDLSRQGEPLKIEAFAGTGKTSTLKAIGEALHDKSCLYLAFNKAIADEASRKFPRNVDCRTSHSLAYRKYGAAYRTRLNQKLNGDALAQFLGVYEFHGIKPKVMCSLALETVRLFCQGNTEEVSKFNIPSKEIAAIGMNADGEAVAERILQIARAAWLEMVNPKGKLPVTHDFYLKLWAMSKPKINADVIMLDEAQDANSLLLGLLMDVLKAGKSQVIFVGDRYQQIYSWRGAINAMQRFQSPNVARLTQSFRFGNAVADVANEVLLKYLGSEHLLKGNPLRDSRLETQQKPKAILCRTNAECIRQVIRALEDGLQVHLQGGTAEFKATIQGIDDLQNGRMPHAQTLSLFTSYDQLVEFSQTELGRDLQTTIKLVKEYGVSGLLGVIENIERVNPQAADVVISTGHKSKGREWESVRLGSDFRGPDSKGYQEEDGNLLYVAVTRAIDVLDLSHLELFKDGKLVTEAQEPEPIPEAVPILSEAPEPEIAAQAVDSSSESPSLETARKGATRGQPLKADAEQIRAYLGRARARNKTTILVSGELSEEAFRELDVLLAVSGNPLSWVESYMSRKARDAMFGAIRKAKFQNVHDMKKLDIRRDVADRLLLLAESCGLNMSDMLDQMVSRWSEESSLPRNAEM